MKKTVLAASILMLYGSLVFAAQPQVQASNGELKAKQMFGQVKTKSENGLVEVSTKVFVSQDGKTLLIGGRSIDTDVVLGIVPKLDVKTPQAQQPPARPPVIKVDYKQLPIDKSITIKKGNGSREFSVFTDVDCPYCKQLETTLKNMDNYTMRVYMMPIEQLHPEAKKKSQSIWCSGDEQARKTAWTNIFETGKAPEVKECANPLDDIKKLAEKLNINGTPTLIRADGILIPGALPQAMLEQYLDGKFPTPQ